MFISHLKDYWANHFAAGSATLSSFMTGHDIIDSIIVGVAVYCITSVLKLIALKLKQWIIK